jgi:hypothetical protein
MFDVLHCFFVDTGPGADIDAILISPDGSALHLVVFMSSSSTLQGQYIVGDGCIINIKAHCSTAYGSLAVLVAYYVFDANYPAQYAMLLAILQIFVMQEPARNLNYLLRNFDHCLIAFLWQTLKVYNRLLAAGLWPVGKV